MLVVKFQIENDTEYTRNLYQAWKLMREKKIEDARVATQSKNKVKDENGNVIVKKQEKPKEKVYKEGEPRPITLDEFI